jgi:hypothetical protein
MSVAVQREMLPEDVSMVMTRAVSGLHSVPAADFLRLQASRRSE